MSGDPKPLSERWRRGAAVVSALLNNQKVEDLDREDVMVAVAFDLIRREEQTKPCAACGTPKVDFHYWKATPAGRLLSEALANTKEGEGA